MIGDVSTLERDLIILWDDMSHAIRELLNANNIVDSDHPVAKYNRPKLTVDEYQPAPEAVAYDNNEVTGEYPNMASRNKYYTKIVHHKMTADEEEIRK